jgi:hypothetical protein
MTATLDAVANGKTDLAHPQAFCHPASLENHDDQRQLPSQGCLQGKRDLLRH